MIKLTLLTTVTVVLLLSGCTSAPIEHSDYRLPLLNQPARGFCDADNYRVVVSDLMLHDGLLLQRSDTTIHAARHHRWSGSLEQQLQQSLQRYFGAQGCGGQLQVTVMDFYGNHGGQAIVSGHWRFSDDNGGERRGNFSQQQPLAADGYSALVNALNTAWQRVLEDIKTATPN